MLLQEEKKNAEILQGLVLILLFLNKKTNSKEVGRSSQMQHLLPYLLLFAILDNGSLGSRN